MKKLYRIIIFSIVINIANNGFAQAKKFHSLNQLDFLIGKWIENDTNSTVVHTYQWSLDSKFIRSQTDAFFYSEEGDTSTHQDIGFFSFDKKRNKIVFRQFHSEGFVNTYVLNDSLTSKNFFVFDSEHTENAGGMRARVSLEMKNKNSYEMILHLAQKAKELVACQWVNAEKIE